MSFLRLVFNGINGSSIDQNFLDILNGNVNFLYDELLKTDKLESVTKNITPDIDNTKDIGSQTLRFRNAFCANGLFNSITVTQLLENSPSILFNATCGFGFESIGETITFYSKNYKPLVVDSGKVQISIATDSQLNVTNTLDSSSMTIGCDANAIKFKREGVEFFKILNNHVWSKSPYLADAATGFRFSLTDKIGLTYDSVNDKVELSNTTASLKLNKDKLEINSAVILSSQRLVGNGDAATINVGNISLLQIEGSVNIKSLSGGVEGTILKVVKTKRNTTVTIINESTDVGVAQKISTKDGSNLVWGNGYNSCDLLFTDGQWVQIN